MTDTVDPIAIDLFLKPFIRSRIHYCWQRHLAMKSRVEYSYLRNVGQDTFNNFNTFEIRRVMQGCKNSHTCNRRLYFRSHQDAFFEHTSTMNDTMPYNIDIRGL